MPKTQSKDKDRTDSILACVAFFGIFHVRALHTTGWKPALNIGIDVANIGTSDIGITPESVVLYYIYNIWATILLYTCYHLDVELWL